MTQRQTSHLERPALRGEMRERSPLEQKIWQRGGELVRNRLHEARAALSEKSFAPTPEIMLGAAYALQAAELEDVEKIEGWTTSEVCVQQIAALMLHLPESTGAKQRLDEDAYSSNYARSADKLTLVQFNHHLLESMSYLPPAMLGDFATTVFERSARLYSAMSARFPLNKRMLEESVKGVEKEVSVMRALYTDLPEGYEAKPATIEQDLKGSDIVVFDENPGETHIDVKANVAFRTKLYKMLESGVISPEDCDKAHEDGFLKLKRDRRNPMEEVRFIMNADNFGVISNFQYDAEGAGRLASAVEAMARQKDQEYNKRLQELINIAKNAMNR